MKATVCISLLAVLCVSPLASATVVHGDFGGGSDVAFLNVREESTTDPNVPLYGCPDYLGNNSLSFSTVDFVSSAEEGGNTDAVQGTLMMSIQAPTDKSLSQVVIYETGEYTLSGSGTDATYAGVVSSLVLTDSLGNEIANVPFSATYHLEDSYGIWDNYYCIDFVEMNLLDVTRVDLVFSNALSTGSEAQSTSLISKQLVYEEVAIQVFVPEPATIALVLFGVVGMILRKK